MTYKSETGEIQETYFPDWIKVFLAEFLPLQNGNYNNFCGISCLGGGPF